MARESNRLSAAKVAKLTAPGRYADGGNLWLQISANGGKSWLLRYMRGGKARHAGLGPLSTVSLAEARNRAQKARLLLLDGIDPIDERNARLAAAKAEAASQVTFKQAAERYVAAYRDSWKNEKHAAQWPSSLARYAYPSFGDLSVSKVETRHVLQAIEPIWLTKTETAARVRGRIEQVLDWATVRSMRRGENPARWRGHLDKILPQRSKVAKVKHHAAMPYDALPTFMARLRAMQFVSAHALELTILCATRTNETIGATWSEFDLEAKVWTIPAERMKADKEHRIPLAARAVEILSALPRIGGEAFVFPGARAGRPLSNMAMLELLRGMDDSASYTVHGFRSSFRDWAGERTNYAREVIESALAHQLKDKAEAAYARGDLLAKRRRLMDAWGAYCTHEAIGSVVNFRGADSVSRQTIGAEITTRRR